MLNDSPNIMRFAAKLFWILEFSIHALIPDVDQLLFNPSMSSLNIPTMAM